MYLKCIEVQGFKSFANKMKFQFHNGITGIVGPNGSGKSNVADAVRWVLGEQSAKQLRGSNMQDVIFSGTESRKPLGFASVAITLDNGDHKLPADFEEVTVTRRLYRSGESEYLINGAACRLRDIQEMFYDTGIGKEGYSIIGQGQIDKILSGKPEERRELFDEAAGIVKFKRRKLAAQKKLEDENNNLSRVNDILSEITRQIGPLEKQSEKAKIYLKKKEEQKSLDINLFLLENERFQGQLAAVEEKLAISAEDVKRAGERLEAAKREYDQAQERLEELDARIGERQAALSRAELERQQMESQITLTREQIRSAKQSESHFEERLSSIARELEEKEGQKKGQQEELAALRETLRAAGEETAACEAEQGRINREAAALEEKIGRDRAALIDLLNQRSNTKAKLQRYDAMTEQIQIRTAELTGRILSAKGEESRLADAGRTLQQEYDVIVSSIEDAIKKNAGIEQKIEQIQEGIRRKNQEAEETTRAFHRESSRLETLQNLTERYDGYGMSIRRVMEQKNRVKGLHGVVADIIRTQKKYETAIETALGGSIQNIVTDNEDTARQMIEFLKQNRFGRATFLPLTAIRKRGGLAREQALYEPGALGVASTLVEAEEQYENLVENLLGQTLVVDTIGHAIAISKKYRQALRIVTLEGELLSPGGSMSGGAFKNSSNLLGRRREVAELEKTVQELTQRSDRLRGELEGLRTERSSRRQELVEATESLQQLYIKQNTAKLRLSEIEEQKSKAVSGNEQLSGEAQELEEQLSQIRAEQEEIAALLRESGEQEDLLEQRIRENQETLESTRQAQEEKAQEAAELHTKMANLSQRGDFIGDNLHRLEGELAALLEEREKILGSRTDFATDVEEKEKEIEKLTEDIRVSEETEEQLGQDLEGLRGQRQKLSAAGKEFFEKREELSEEQGRLDKERFRLDSQKERLEDYRDRQVSYMWEEYGLTASEAAAYRKEGQTDAALLKKQIAQVKGEIKALGPVNVDAIEEYKETAERHAFLKTQYDDLTKAGEALKKVIADLDTGMRRQFAEQFAVIQKEFEKSFKELFGGGTGTLELVEGEDVLEAGIRIIAQPPGKKLVNMMQMSGGEKALTAIALLFAIQNMKPSPFCLLDEIEAALDENNVVRYAQYLKKLTKNTQFIIITHRRGTMAAADRLYGITMQEKGVSTQVSVNIVEGELDK